MVIETCAAVEANAVLCADRTGATWTAEWYRHNMKRKLAKLPPISREMYVQLQSGKEAQVIIAYDCDLCSRAFHSRAALDSHLTTKKHHQHWQKNQRKLIREGIVLVDLVPSIATSHDKNDGQGDHQLSTSPVISTTRAVANDMLEYAQGMCLFCSHTESDMHDALLHMQSKHSFFIPDIEYLIDLPGLLQYLGDKVYIQHACLKCHSKFRINSDGEKFGVATPHSSSSNNSTGIFTSRKSCWSHMISKGHCGIIYEDGAQRELQQFYDFFNDADSVGSYELIETDGNSEEESMAFSEDSTATVTSDSTLDDVISESILASRHRLGHRGYNQYYRQRVRRTSDSSTAVSASTGADCNMPTHAVSLITRTKQGHGDQMLLTPEMLTMLANSRGHLSRTVRRFLHDINLRKPVTIAPEKIAQVVKLCLQQMVMSEQKKAKTRNQLPLSPKK